MKWVASSSDRRIWGGISGREVGINSNAHNPGHVTIRVIDPAGAECWLAV